MNFLKKYGPPAAALLLIWLAKHFWGEKGELTAVIICVAGAVVALIAAFCYFWRKKRFCAGCGRESDSGEQ